MTHYGFLSFDVPFNSTVAAEFMLVICALQRQHRDYADPYVGNKQYFA